ncbi:MarR family transcriptional regulator [Streptomyces cynarae]|uniref:MarR family transcriptional regulator n=1 Tax=Streptomyces cynarae TaxID=2981134 RepID=UPI00406C11AD
MDEALPSSYSYSNSGGGECLESPMPTANRIASLLDRLPENAAMDAKTIARFQPLYGQQAVRSALNELSKAGHLRRVRRRVELGGEGGAVTGTRWVFHTYWSRTARDDDWGARFLNGDTAAESLCEPRVTPTATVQPEVSHFHTPGQPSAACAALARLGLLDPRLALSASDCSDLERLAEDWLARGTTPEYLTQVLLAGLPDQVYSPRAFVQRRLIDKMPPERPTTPSRAPRTLLECTHCGVPGRPEVLLGGLCRACRGGDGSTPLDLTRTQYAAVRTRAAQGATRSARPSGCEVIAKPPHAAHVTPLVDIPLSAQKPGHTVAA